ncbi:hypothetical protein [Burkholderia sp. AU28863]|uniref:hypothetical protein n=1 Tax=Burkholderia sp. AU28863 TaxID=2015352 RepID=UPI0011775FC2|nr:hypothetical protein [Burkholderia sp. AU28863]
MTYRLYRRNPVVKGDWYYAFKCKRCGELIYSLDDLSKGAGNVNFAGDGIFSVPCGLCSHDDLYRVEDIRLVQSEEGRPSTYPERIAISKASRKPLLKSYPNAKVTMGVGYIEDRPRAAALVGRIITSWADIEVQVTRLLAELMGANIPEVSAVFGSLRNSRAQSDALIAAAEVALDERDYALFSAHVSRKASLEKERNDLAHGCFGVSVGIPDHIVWVSQADFLSFNAAHKVGQKFDLAEKQFVYELGTLERIASEIVEFYDQLGSLTGYLLARHRGQDGEAYRVKRYPELCNQPHIREALKQVKGRKQK